MRRIYSILVLTAVLAGCQHEDDLTTGDVGTLTFSASIADAVYSRAVQGVDFAQGIYIAGYHTQGTFAEAMAADSTVIYPNIFDCNPADGQLPVPHVSKSGQNKFVLNTVKWKLDPETYLSYFAWSQGAAATTNSGIVAATKDNTTTGYPWIEVENVDDPALQIDVAAARHTDEKNHRVISAVDLDFKHVLSKLTFVFKCSAGATVTLGKMNLKYATDQIRSEGRYTFNTNPADSIGHFCGLAGYHAGTFSLGTHHVLANGQEVTAGEMLLIPQSVTKGFVTFDLEYTIASSEGTYKHTKTVDMPATKLLEGTNHIYTIDIYGEQVIVHNAAVSGWIPDATPRLPFVPGPMGDTQLLLDGYDKPYQHVDGKWYWLDCSGYNRHCWLDGYTPELYDETNHFYSLDGKGASKIVVPAFNNVTELTTDVVCEHAATGISGPDVMQVVNFRTTGITNRKFTIQMSSAAAGTTNFDGKIYFDCDAARTGRLEKNLGNYNSFTTRTLWTFQKNDGGNMNIYQNASLIATRSASGLQNLGVMDNNEIARGYNGKIFYVKVTSKINKAVEVLKTYKRLQPRFNISNQGVTQLFPPVRNNLVIYFDGYNEPVVEGGKTLWKDMAGVHNNHAEIIGLDKVSYTGDGYRFKPDGYMALIKAASATFYPYNQKLTFEIVYQPTSNSSTMDAILMLISTDNPNAHTTGEAVYKGSNQYHFLSEYGRSSRYRNLATCSNPGVGDNDYMYWKNDRAREQNISWVNGVQYVGNGGSTAAYGYMFIGRAFAMGGASLWCDSHIKAIRIHNRILTDAEIQQNYEFDKIYYGSE